MNNVTTGIALFAIIAVLVAYIIRRSEDLDLAAAKAYADEEREKARKDEAERRRMVHEADSKPVSMDPFCGEGKKP